MKRGRLSEIFNSINKKAIIIVLCMISIFLCGIVIGYNIGLEERYKMLSLLSRSIIPPQVKPFNPFTYI